MTLGRESLVLVGIPLALLAGALVFFSDGSHEETLTSAALESNPDPIRVARGAVPPAARRVDARSQSRVVVEAPNRGGAVPPRQSGESGGERSEVLGTRSGERRGRAEPSASGASAPPARRPVVGSMESAADDVTSTSASKPTPNSLQSRVVDADGNPLSAAVVVVREHGNLLDRELRPFGEGRELFGVALVDGGGEFVVPTTSGRTYEVFVSSDGYSASYHRASVALPPTIVMSRPGRLHGVIRRASDDAPISGVTVTIQSGAVRKAVMTDDAGGYLFEEVPAEGLLVEVRHPAWRPERVRINRILQDAVVRRDFRLDPGAELRGRVVSATDGSPVPSIDVELFEVYRAQIFGIATSDANGEFRFGGLVPNGRYRAAVISGGRGDSAAYFDVDLNGEIPPVELVVDGTWALEGVVLDEGGLPIENVVLTLRDVVTGSPVPERSVLSNDSGEFRFDGLGAQRHFSLAAWHPDYVPLTFADVQAGEASFTSVQLRLVGGGRVGGVVRDQSGAPLAGALVRLSTRGDSGATSPASEFLYTYTDSDGAFEFDHAPSGGIVLLVLAPRFHEATVEASVLEGGHVDVGLIELRLR